MNSLVYTPPAILFNAHLETIYPSLLRKVHTVPYEPERIVTPDNDFLDLDWLCHPVAEKSGERNLVIISHGLEGNSNRAYVKGMAKAFYDKGTDALAWTYRGCGTEMNKLVRFYHAGTTDDLSTLIDHAAALNVYDNIYLIGFSLGGNMTLKYLGERGENLPAQIKKAVVFSVPMDLLTGSARISEPGNCIYARRFLKSLKLKVKTKASIMAGIKVDGIDDIRDLATFDDVYTSRLHGFKDAFDYYTQNSANRFVSNITVPTLIVNAKNDPFLSPECFPVAQLKDHPFVTLETPDRGGHVGFTLFNSNGLYWSELRALAFIQS